MALGCGLSSRAMAILIMILVTACGSESASRTEVFVSIDAEGGALAATSVRVQINTLVIEVEREGWPLELIVQPEAGNAKRRFTLRAWGLKDSVVLGAASNDVGFKDGSRDVVSLRLVPGVDLGSVPAVNAKAERGKVVKQPVDVKPYFDGGSNGHGDGDGDGLANGPGDGGSDTGAADAEADGSADSSDASLQPPKAGLCEGCLSDSDCDSSKNLRCDLTNRSCTPVGVGGTCPEAMVFRGNGEACGVHPSLTCSQSLKAAPPNGVSGGWCKPCSATVPCNFGGCHMGYCVTSSCYPTNTCPSPSVLTQVGSGCICTLPEGCEVYVRKYL